MIIPSYINVLGFSENRDAGIRAKQEANRIGMEAEIFWNISSRWDKLCLDNIRDKSDYMSKASAFSCLRGHYHILKKELDFGSESAWIVEDDVRFHKDIGLVQKRIMSAPGDADFLLLDYGVWGEAGSENYERCRKKIKESRGGWWRVETEDVRGAGNYIVGRDAMCRYCDMLSQGYDGSCIFAADLNRDERWFPGMKIYAASPNISIQQLDPEYKHMCGHDALIAYRKRNMISDEEAKQYQPW